MYNIGGEPDRYYLEEWGREIDTRKILVRRTVYGPRSRKIPQTPQFENRTHCSTPHRIEHLGAYLEQTPVDYFMIRHGAKSEQEAR